MKKEFPKERRKNVRVDKNVPLKIFSIDKYDTILETKNISASGAYCGLDFKIPEMTKLQVTLLIPSSDKIQAKKVNCEGVVVRVEKKSHNDKYNVAIYFSKINKSDKKFIEQYVRHHISKENRNHEGSMS